MNTSPETSWQRDCTEHFNRNLREHLSGIAIQAAMDCPKPAHNQTAVEAAVDEEILALWRIKQQHDHVAEATQHESAIRPKRRVVLKYKTPVGDSH